MPLKVAPAKRVYLKIEDRGGVLGHLAPRFASSPFYKDMQLFPLATAASVTLAEVAEKIGIHIDTLRKKAKSGLLPGAFKIGSGGWRAPHSRTPKKKGCTSARE
jgi:hypothetical protein